MLKNNNNNNKNKTLRELSLGHAFYLVRVVRVADISVTWLVYVRTYCVPIATLNQKQAISITLFGRRPNKKTYVNINW